MSLTPEQQTEKEALVQKFGLQLLDQLVAPVPPELAVRFRFPQRCPHCKRRPELLESFKDGLEIQIRVHESATLRIPRYDFLPCCSASYSTKHVQTTISKRQSRQLREQHQDE